MKAIIFDFDGVIHDTFELVHRINTIVLGKEMDKDKYKDYFNGNLYDKIDVKTEVQQKFEKLHSEEFKLLKIEEDIKNHLEELHKKYPLFIITSNNETNLETYFHNNDLKHIFKEILGVETHTSKVEKFNMIFEKHNLKVDECVFVTDTLGDILEGNKVGIKTIAVDFGFHEKKRLEKGNPYKIVSNFDDIIKTIEEL